MQAAVLGLAPSQPLLRPFALGQVNEEPQDLAAHVNIPELNVPYRAILAGHLEFQALGSPILFGGLP